MVRFDWYQATVHHLEVNDVLDAFLSVGDRRSIDTRRGVQGYAMDTHVLDADGTVARVWWGRPDDSRPHVVLSGDPTPAGVETLRAAFPSHSVTRVDACIDLLEPDAFETLQPIMLSIADRHRVKVGTAGDHFLKKSDGRTLYLGSPKSSALCRLYDKAAQLRQKFAADPARLALVPEHLTRLELQAKPKTREARQAFSTIEPLAVMGSSTWSRALWKDVADVDLEPVLLYRPWRQSDDDRAYTYCLAQYGAMLERKAADVGWDCLGLQIGFDLGERAIAKRKGK